ncbi:T9SS type A sorting domain-containing protein [Pedobacter cryophilus]|uniref:T9SS type A sorting domain-containing protein n=1 Tax=Pedobacter cryophilus TaxID=2571271 RepID=A0A4U1BXY2_9SPHI|nr:T9SS type A sorting domain-containing protein [Pedobacter cryophilus]TKB96249.1 T9SS type A sorting domain-containing protein [Pedobacter cryophilus]
MKKNLLKICLIFFTVAMVTTTSKAQNNGDFRSVTSGGWATLATWETYDVATTSWIPAIAVPTNGNNVTVLNTHIITLDGTKGVNKLTIDAGAVVKSAGGTIRNVRVQESIINNGSFGASGSNERLSIEGYAVNGTITITGTGVYLVSLIRNNGISQNVDFVIDADLNVSSYISGPYTLSSGTSNSASQGDDNVNIIINAGKTVTCGSSSYLHAPSGNTTITTDFYGSYTYTINGTLDMTTSTTSCVVAHNTIGSVTINVNGTWKMGSALRTASAFATMPVGIAAFNLGTNGVIDASLNAAGTNLVMTNSTSGLYTFFNITGNGILKQNPSKHSSQGIFRVGTANFYSPVTIGAVAAPNAVYAVNVSAVPDGTKKVVNRVWDISSPTTVADLNLTFGAVAGIEKNGFNITPDPVLVYNWLGAAWGAGTTATAAGSGTVADPHTAAITLVNTLGKFSVANEEPIVLPLKFIAFTAKANVAGNQALLNWTTAEEKNTLDFVIEKSIDGVVFSSIGIVGAKNASGIHPYNFIDNAVNSGVSYYRINQRDLDGKSAISKVVFVNIKSQIAISAYPNPVVNELYISHPLTSKEGQIVVYDLAGKKIANQKIISGTALSTVKVSQLVPAIYLLEVNTGSDTVRKRFIKE